MKHTFSDSDSSLQTEHMARRLFRKSGALATIALVGASLTHSNTEEVDVHVVPAPGYILRNSRGEAVPPPTGEETVTLASQGGEPAAFYPNTSTAVETAQGGEAYCRVVDLPLVRRIDYEEVVKGAQTDFALSTEEYRSLNAELEDAKTIKQAQDIIYPVLANIGVRAEFDAPTDTTYETSQTTQDVSNYIKGMRKFLSSLTTLPYAMVAYVPTINFLDTDGFPIRRGNGEMMQAGGTYNAGKREITLATRGIYEELVPHEFAHAMHDKACEGKSDKELEDEFNQVMKLLQSGWDTAELEARFWNKDKAEVQGRVEGDEDDFEKFLLHGKENGVPTAYSRTNYVELLAEITTDMICNKGLFSDAATSLNEKESAGLLKKMVIDRLQTAMPNVPVTAYLEYVTNYEHLPPSLLDPRQVIDHRISSLDATYAYYGGMYYHEESGWTLTPAIAIRGQHGAPDQYVYAYEDKANNQVEIMMTLPESSDDAKLALTQAAITYLKSLPDYRGGRIMSIPFNGLAEDKREDGIDLVIKKERPITKR